MDLLPAYAMPLEGLIGGLMIGVSSALMLLGLGRIAGISGLAARASGISTDGPRRGIAAAFIIGLPLGALLVASLLGPVATRFNTDVATLVIGGLLVGFGTRLGSGCTSGHGVCGMSRLSPRSLVSTITFISTGIITVTLLDMLGTN